MLSLLERNIASIDQRLVILAPPGAGFPQSLENVTANTSRHSEMVRQMQRLRGRVYLDEGAIQPHQLSADGRHQTVEDDRAWHLLILNREQKVSACAWYLEHDQAVSMQQLRVRHSPLMTMPEWRDRLRVAVERELAEAKRESLRYAEVGGWAVAEDCRCRSEGLLLALAAYSLSGLFGGALGMTTATVKHGSSTILRRLGGRYFEAEGRPVPAYYDAKYQSDIELLRFDSRRPNPKYRKLIDLLSARLTNVAVIAETAARVVTGPRLVKPYAA
jgi:hypothetical protein